MCGIFFVHSKSKLKFSLSKLNYSFSLLKFRGPDFQTSMFVNKNTFTGHARLEIIGNRLQGKQPSLINDTLLIFNGEIYNYKQLAKQYFPNQIFFTDTNLLHNLLNLKGISILDKIEGMFSFVYYNIKNHQTYAVRDRFGIKPLFYYRDANYLAFSSESNALAHLFDDQLDQCSLLEWQKMRMYCPGYSYYKKIKEVRPGHYKTNEFTRKWYQLKSVDHNSSFNTLFSQSVLSHSHSDYPVTSFLSGGVDSSLIALNTNFDRYYTAGTKNCNEFKESKEFSAKAEKNIIIQNFTDGEIIDALKYLVSIRKEPVSLPNEALIYLSCINIVNEKVILSGEGADEIFFGYDKIFRYMSKCNKTDLDQFLSYYSYSNIRLTDRFYQFLIELSQNSNPLEFCEDFFIQFHLPCLLRRLDSPSMIAGKEARVPFLDHKIVESFYRKPVDTKLTASRGKKLLGNELKKIGYGHIFNIKKVGFITSTLPKQKLYKQFRKIVLEELL